MLGTSRRRRWMRAAVGGAMVAIAASWGGSMPSQAQSAAVPVVVVVQPRQTFDNLIAGARREALAQIRAQFVGNPNLDRATVVISAQKGSLRAPILMAEVTRERWSRNPGAIGQWSRVLEKSEVLLGFSGPPVVSTPSQPKQTVARATSTRTPSAPKTTTTPSSSRQSSGSTTNPGERLAKSIEVRSSVQPQVVAMPSGLQSYRYDTKAGDFLDEIRQNSAGGYTRWVNYPVKVFIEPGHADWATFVKQAVDEWSVYVPMTETADAESADIRIYRVAPIRGISGAASPEYFTADDGSLRHRVTIVLSLFQSLPEVTTVTRHELGHALGLWGHTASPLDLMYGGNHADATGGRRVLRVAPISKMDINTLKRVYEQPTLVGQTGS
ncbi:MAG: hypothetical protein AAFY57_05955 [Cyanobacteria bacterium J06642_2]